MAEDLTNYLSTNGIAVKYMHHDVKTIERMELIKNQKDEFSLDDLSKQLVSEGEKKALLIMDTAFGEKSFRLDEIKSIFVDDGDGHKTNVKEYLENIIRKNGGD